MRRSAPYAKVPPAVSERAEEIEAHLRASNFFRIGPGVRARLPDPASPECARLAAAGALREAEEKARLGVKVIARSSGPQLRARRR